MCLQVNIFFLELSNHRYITLKGPLYDLLQRYDNHLIKTAFCYLNHIAPSGVINPINTNPLFANVEFRSLMEVRAFTIGEPLMCLSYKLPDPVKTFIYIDSKRHRNKLLTVYLVTHNVGMFYQRRCKHLRRGNTQGKKTYNLCISIVPILIFLFRLYVKEPFSEIMERQNSRLV